MEITNNKKHNLATIGWGTLFIWWGISFMVGPITIGLSAAGTGVILLGVNVARRFMGIPTNRSTYCWGVIALAWGLLDHMLKLKFELSAAVLLILIGSVTVLSLLVRGNLDQSEKSTEL
jgi:hypothetical protein